MNPLRALGLAGFCLVGLAARASPTLLHVSESGDKRLAVYVMNDRSGELTRRGAVDLPGAPGTFVFSADRHSGELKFLSHTPTEKTPPSFCIMPGGENFVVSAGYNPNRLMVFRRDNASGKLTPLKAHDCGKGPVSVVGA